MYKRKQPSRLQKTSQQQNMFTSTYHRTSNKTERTPTADTTIGKKKQKQNRK